MYFPMDLILDIFIQLPVKTLLRFKTVSKTWRSLIEDSNFVSSHLKFANKTSRGLKVVTRSGDSLLCSGDLDLPGSCCFRFLGLPTDKNNQGKDSFLIGSCNGLICLRHSNKLILWNKSTGEYCNINLPRVDKKSNWVNYGFGYDSVNDDYKVMYTVRHSQVYQTKVYSLKQDIWKSTKCKSKTLPYFTGGKPYDSRIRKGFFVGGALHWLARRVERIRNDTFTIFSFDITTEAFVEAALPENTWCCILGSFNNCLTATCYIWGGGTRLSEYIIWVMDDMVTKAWKKMFDVTKRGGGVHDLIKKPLAYSMFRNKILLRCGRRGFLWFDPREEVPDEYFRYHPSSIPWKPSLYSSTYKAFSEWEVEICLDTLVSISAYRGNQYESIKEKIVAFLKRKAVEFSIFTLLLKC